MSKALLKPAPLLLVAVFLFASCNQNTVNAPASQATPSPQVALNVREADSPAGAGSREPKLFSTADGRVILSWVENS